MTEPGHRPQGAEVTLALRAQPRAPRTGFGAWVGTELKVRVAAPPVDDAANAELLRFLAHHFGLPRGQVRLLRGRTGRRKVVGLAGLTPAQVRERLPAGAPPTSPEPAVPAR